MENSINASAQTYRLAFSRTRNEDYVAVLGAGVMSSARAQIERLSSERNLKWYLTLSMVFHRAARPDILTEPPVYFRTEPVASTSSNPIELQLKVALRRLWQEIDTYEENGSGWVLDHLIELDLHVVAYDPLRAGAHMKLPQWLTKLKAVRNIQNNDDDW